jgi:hypothetical protein
MSTTDTEGQRRRNLLIAVAALLLILVVVALALASSAGLLPWQPEPTRIPITPFADLPGRGAGTPTP